MTWPRAAAPPGPEIVTSWPRPMRPAPAHDEQRPGEPLSPAPGSPRGSSDRLHCRFGRGRASASVRAGRSAGPASRAGSVGPAGRHVGQPLRRPGSVQRLAARSSAGEARTRARARRPARARRGSRRRAARTASSRANWPSSGRAASIGSKALCWRKTSRRSRADLEQARGRGRCSAVGADQLRRSRAALAPAAAARWRPCASSGHSAADRPSPNHGASRSA